MAINSLIPQELIELIELPFLIKDERGVVISHNKPFEDLNGLKHRRIIGLTVDQFLTKKEADTHRQMDIELINSEGKCLKYEISRINHDQSHCRMQVYKSFANNTAGLGQILVAVKPILTLGCKQQDHTLTPRELNILKLLTQGYSQKKIALVLVISKHTVGDHLKSIYLKLGVHSRAEAQLLALTQLGITDLMTSKPK